MPSSCISRCVPGFVVLLAWLGVSETSEAHFVLTSPSSMYEQSGLGDPQKAAPCGNHMGNAVATGEVTAVQGGDTITVTIDETIFHPGHYRIALALDDGVFPDEPPVTAGATDCGSAPIDPAPAFPVLADGVWEHTEPFGGPQSIDITIPDGISCTSCTLQVIQFMSNHALNDPGGCYYHHCATLSVEPSGAETEGPETTTSPGDDSGGMSSGDSPGTTAADDTAGLDTAVDADLGGETYPNDTASTSVASETDTAQAPASDEGGCSCTTPAGDSRGSLGVLLGLFVLAGLQRRRTRP